MVEDDGIGIAEDLSVKGKGLNGIQSKIAYLNGKIEISRRKENGTLIVIEIEV
jgi:glucose-6-phosphate-specific signal transduction histidine kinase